MKNYFTRLFVKFYEFLLLAAHVLGRISGKYYFEDYLRVYPGDVTYYPFGIKRKASKDMINNFLNHSKFYIFASQFVKGKVIADIGCGSGYGTEILKSAGAEEVYGCDISNHSIDFARNKYSNIAKFSIQGITDLNLYNDNFFNVTVCGEVLEHIAEYGMEATALKELKRITKKGGLVIIGTPNNEIIEDHGFSFDAINNLMKSEFKEYCIFENALIPAGERKKLWNRRLKLGKTGIVISEEIKESEIALEGVETTKLKVGRNPGIYKFKGLKINTKLLHNTHSWIVIGIKDS